MSYLDLRAKHKFMALFTPSFTRILLQQIKLVGNFIFSRKCIIILLILEIICYDDGCHLYKYATNPRRSQLTPLTRRIANLKIVIDRLHFSGHIDTWCRAHCNPYNLEELCEVN